MVFARRIVFLWLDFSSFIGARLLDDSSIANKAAEGMCGGFYGVTSLGTYRYNLTAYLLPCVTSTCRIIRPTSYFHDTMESHFVAFFLSLREFRCCWFSCGGCDISFVSCRLYVPELYLSDSVIVSMKSARYTVFFYSYYMHLNAEYFVWSKGSLYPLVISTT